MTDEYEADEFKELRAKADEADSLRKELEVTKAVAAADLGTLNEKQTRALLAAHDGDLTAEALRDTALGLGFVKEPVVEAPAEQVAADEVAAAQRAAQVTGGGDPIAPVNELQAMRDRILTAPVGTISQMSPLYLEAKAAIANSGLTFGSQEHGDITPLAAQG